MVHCVFTATFTIIRPHRSTMYTDAAYCYRRTNVVCLSVYLSWSRLTSPAKTAEPIEMPFGMWTWVDGSKHVLDGVHIGASWRIRLNRPCAAAIRPFVKIFWSLVIPGYFINHCELQTVNCGYLDKPTTWVTQEVTTAMPRDICH